MNNFAHNNRMLKRIAGLGAIAGALAISWGSGAVIAQENQDQPRRPRPAFFEESRRGNRAGFSDTFLGDALNGSADPLSGGGAAGTGSDTTTVDNAISQPRGRAAQPAITVDRTRVIIPNAGEVRSTGSR
ncbi:MAG: hypothetical protein AAF685_08835 [Cyanobacteria bacterium P01_C01_bin.89]